MSNSIFDWPASLKRFVRFTSAKAEEVNDALDDLSAGLDTVEANIARAVKLPIGTADQTLALAAGQRAGLLLGFDPSGNIAGIAGGGRWRGDWSAGTQYVISDYFIDPVSKSIYACLEQHTSASIAADLAAGKVRLAIDVAAVEGQRILAQQAAVAADQSNTLSSQNASASAASAAMASADASSASASAIAASKLNLGDKATEPTVDNQGGALRAGATYYNTTTNKWRVWTGSAWGDGVSAAGNLVSKSGDTMIGQLTLVDQALPITTNNLPTLRPSLLLDFANGRSVDPRITFTRSSTATRTNEKGLIETVAANVPRIHFDPVTGACLGLLREEQRTNLLLNSTIDGASLASQTVTVTAVAYTISFYGTGTVTLSGAHVASAVGVGAYPSRTTLTFTPTAGSLTLTVTGTVQFAQQEAGTSPTSFIPTAGAAVTRAADVMEMTGTNFSSWYRQDEGTLIIYRADAAFNATGTSDFTIRNDAGTNAIQLRQGTIIAGVDMVVITNGSAVVDTASFAIAKGVSYKAAIAFKKGDFAISVNGLTAITDTFGDLGAMTKMQFSNDVCSTYERIAYYPKRLTNAELQALTTR